MKRMMQQIGMIVLSVMFIAGAAYAQPAAQPESRQITVTGEAVVKVKPDTVILTFGIETNHKNIMTAKDENNAALKKTVAAIMGLGIEEKEIQTDYLSIEPRYDSSYSNQNFLGYFARNTVAVTLTQPEKFEELLTGILESGVNYIHGIEFQTSELRKYRDQARELALKAAKEKAESMAAVLEQKIGKPLRIQENMGGSPWWYYSGWGYGRGGAMSQNVMQNVPSSGENGGETSDTVALGKISVRANVTVTFELQ